jgi:hypothetical protein
MVVSTYHHAPYHYGDYSLPLTLLAVGRSSATAGRASTAAVAGPQISHLP